MNRIEKEAEDYASLFYGKNLSPDLYNQLKTANEQGALSEQARAHKLVEALKRMKKDLELNINPMIEAFGGHPATLSVKDIEQALSDWEGEKEGE